MQTTTRNLLIDTRPPRRRPRTLGIRLRRRLHELRLTADRIGAELLVGPGGPR